MARVTPLVLAALGAADALGCTWGPTSFKIAPLNHGWSFCCPGLDGKVAHQASAVFASVNNDEYSIRPGISSMQLSSSCENHIDEWYQEDKYSDNFQHTSSGSYGPVRTSVSVPLQQVTFPSPKVAGSRPAAAGELSDRDGGVSLLVPQQADLVPNQGRLDQHRREPHPERHHRRGVS